LPGILRNSQEKELKKNPHRDDFPERELNLHRKGLKKIRHRDDFHKSQGKLKNLPMQLTLQSFLFMRWNFHFLSAHYIIVPYLSQNQTVHVRLSAVGSAIELYLQAVEVYPDTVVFTFLIFTF
jgi:hypothetical protein